MNAAAQQKPTYAERELTITRVFDAPRALVFQAWTDAKHLAQWWGPRDFTNPVCEIEARAGGAIRIHMRGPDGVVYKMKARFARSSRRSGWCSPPSPWMTPTIRSLRD